MESQHHEPPQNQRRYWLIAAALVIWVVVIISGAGGSQDDALLGIEHLDSVYVALMIVFALLGLALLIVLNPFSRGWAKPDLPRRSGGRTGMVLLVVLALLLWRPDLIERLMDTTEPEQEGLASLEPPAADVVETAPETVAQLSDILLLLAAVALVVALWFVLRRQRVSAEIADEPKAEAALEADLALALEQLAVDLETSNDPRMAVLASYAVLESVLADHGSQRLHSETPAEHLRRSLAHLRVDASAIVHLGELYELARFSNHVITEREQREALSSLHRARAVLGSLT